MIGSNLYDFIKLYEFYIIFSEIHSKVWNTHKFYSIKCGKKGVLESILFLSTETCYIVSKINIKYKIYYTRNQNIKY